MKLGEKIDLAKFHPQMEAVAQAKFGEVIPVLVSELRTKDGGWSNRPAVIFYQKNPGPGHSNFPALFVANGKMMITDASYFVGMSLIGAQDSNGDIWYSTHRHDCVSLPDGGYIDGGRAYTRFSTDCKLVGFTISPNEKSNFAINNSLIFERTI